MASRRRWIPDWDGVWLAWGRGVAWSIWGTWLGIPELVEERDFGDVTRAFDQSQTLFHDDYDVSNSNDDHNDNQIDDNNENNIKNELW